MVPNQLLMDFPCSMVSSTKKLCTLLFLFCMLLSPLLYLSQSLYPFFHTKTLDIPLEINSGTDNSTDPCIGRYIYVYHLPKQFNSQILDGCHNLCLWYDMCELIVNSGLGPELDNNDGVLQETGWYFTHQYVLEIIFHNRMKQYECLTTNYSMASAVFVPYYSGLDIMRYLWDTSTDQKSRIDKLAVELVDWLRKRSEWAAKRGKDHFIVSGRPTSDFQRDEVSSWGSNFLNIPDLVYKDPRYVSEDLKDAFDVAVNGVLDRVREKCLMFQRLVLVCRPAISFGHIVLDKPLFDPILPFSPPGSRNLLCFLPEA